MTTAIKVRSITVVWHGREVQIDLNSSGCDYRPVNWWPQAKDWAEQFDEELGLTKLGLYLGNIYFGDGSE